MVCAACEPRVCKSRLAADTMHSSPTAGMAGTGGDENDLAAQMEAAAEQLAAAKRKHEAERRQEAIAQVPAAARLQGAVAARCFFSMCRVQRHQSAPGKHAGVGAQVEMVLQTYYHNLDNTYNKLQTVHEYMTDIEAGGCSACPSACAGAAFLRTC